MKKIFIILVLTFIYTSIFSQNTAGYYHNEILKSIFTQDDYAKTLKDPNLLKEYIVTKLINDDPQIFQRQEMESIFKESDRIFKTLNLSFYNFTETEARKSVKYLVDNNKISSKLANIFYDTFRKVYSHESSVPSIIKFVEGIKTMGLNQNDKMYADTFKDIFLSSYEFWSGPDDDDIILAFGWKDLVTVCADTAGCLIGLTASPAGSIIIGGYCSGLWVGLNMEL